MKKTLCFILTLLTFVTLVFLPDSFAQDDSPEYVVRAIYFYPNDLQPHPDIDAILDYFIKDFQRHFADRMEFHGFGRKTFRFEANGSGDVIVHQVKGDFNDTHYSGETYSKVLQEFYSRFGESKNIDFFVIDTRNPIGSDPATGNLVHRCGIGWGNSRRGFVVVPAQGNCFGGQVPGTVNDIYDFIRGFGVHELLHAFGMHHDTSGPDTLDLTYCAAEWLDGHPYFNYGQDKVVNDDTTLQMLPPMLASPPATIRLQFEITDPDGLHQAQLIREGDPIIACQKLNGTNTTVEFITTELLGVNTIFLQVMDAHGNFTFRGQRFTIDITNLLPSPAAISIPDPILRMALRSSLNLAADEPITQLNILNLRYFGLFDKPVKDLTGLEYASNLHRLYIEGAGGQIQDITPITALKNLHQLSLSDYQIQDITPITALKNLGGLYLVNNRIQDITPLAQFTRLSGLNLSANQISDISPLANLTNLTFLSANSNSVMDIGPLARLTRLEGLRLSANQISDISPLARLTRLERLLLNANQIRDITVLQNLTNLTELHLFSNQITDVSPLVDLINLEELYLAGNPIEDFSPLRTLLAKNPNLKIDIDIPFGFSTNFISDQTFIIGTDVSLTLPIAASGTAPYTYSLSPIPAGLQFDRSTRVLSGTPTIVGTTNATYTATDATGASAALNFTIEVISEDVPADVPLDVNGDGSVNVLDLVLISINFGKTGQNPADVNGDGIVNIVDLVKVASAMGEGAAAPAAFPQTLEILTAADVRHWLTQAQQLSVTNMTSQRGILFLEQLLAALIPKETSLLPNYPNPFNPETWIPYQLAEPAEVTLYIYAVNGTLIRTLALGHQPAGMYHSKNRAVYWDGKNELGESVASGVYFYTLSTGDFSATRKLLIRK